MIHPEDQFNDLRTLLGSKRYEQPPPAYFVTFSDRVIARIEAEEAPSYSSWWSWLIHRFDAKPVFVCVYSMAISSLLFLGFRLSQVFDAELAAAPMVGGGPWLALSPSSPLLLPHRFERAGYTGSMEPSSLARSTWVFGDAASQFVLPASWPHPHVFGFPSEN